MADTWTMEDMRADFAAIADAAYSGKPQFVTNGSSPALVIMTARQFEEMKKNEEAENKRFVEFLMSGPKGDIFPDGYKPTEIIPREVEF